MRRILKETSLSITVVTVFLLIWIGGQSTAGYRMYNVERTRDGEAPISFVSYFGTAHFGEATFENWDSEFLQMGMYVVLTVKLRQKGSSESKPLDELTPQDEDPADHRDDPDAPWPVKRGGNWLLLYRNSSSIGFFALFSAYFALHAWTGSHAFDTELASAGSTSLVTPFSYLTTSQFWFESLQNWQSEFLAVAAIVLLSMFLRQHGRPNRRQSTPHAGRPATERECLPASFGARPGSAQVGALSKLLLPETTTCLPSSPLSSTDDDELTVTPPLGAARTPLK